MISLSAWSRKLFDEAFELNSQNIISTVLGADFPKGGSMIDLGCGTGELTAKVAAALEAGSTTVVEVYEPHALEARARGFDVVDADLNGALPFDSDVFDLVMSNQVFEHLYDTETFVSECARITRPGGLVIVATENAASWHNVAALVLGWQAFSLTNVSNRVAGIGNPLAIHRGGEGWVFPMQHHRVFSLRGLKELGEVNGLTHVASHGAGYHPLPAIVGRWNPAHAHFIGALFRKAG